MSELNCVDNIYNILKNRIITNIYSPGELLSENTIAAEFNVSRTPVREALKQLQNEKWIITIPKVGIKVSTIEVNELKNNFQVRKALETLVITTLIEKGIDDETFEILEEIANKCKTIDPSSLEAIENDVHFHQVLWNLCNNEILVRYLEELNYGEQRWWYYMKKINPDLKEVGDMGSLIYLVDFLKKKDLNNALKVMYKHLEYYILQIKNTFF